MRGTKAFPARIDHGGFARGTPFAKNGRGDGGLSASQKGVAPPESGGRFLRANVDRALPYISESTHIRLEWGPKIGS
jgi:hypothetical protein